MPRPERWPYRPTDKTLRAVVEYMGRELGLQVYGLCTDVFLVVDKKGEWK